MNWAGGFTSSSPWPRPLRPPGPISSTHTLPGCHPGQPGSIRTVLETFLGSEYQRDGFPPFIAAPVFPVSCPDKRCSTIVGRLLKLLSHWATLQRERSPQKFGCSRHTRMCGCKDAISGSSGWSAISEDATTDPPRCHALVSPQSPSNAFSQMEGCLSCYTHTPTHTPLMGLLPNATFGPNYQVVSISWTSRHAAH